MRIRHTRVVYSEKESTLTKMINITMEQESEKIETKAENSSLSDAQDRALKHWNAVKQYRTRGIEEAWECGRALCEVKRELPHGGFRKWLKSVGITKSKAHRWMRFSEHYQLSQIGTFNSVDQALKDIQSAREKLKEPAKEVEPDVETEGKASSVQQEEVTDGNGTLPLPVEIESPQQIQQLSEKVRETEEKLRKAEEEVAELHETKDQLRVAEERIAELLQENKQLKRQLEEKGTPKETTSVDQQQIYSHSAFSVNSEDPGSGEARTTAAPVSRENTENPDPI